MGYVVLQKGLEVPRLEQLRESFRGLRDLTPADAAMMSRNSLGILVRGIDQAEAQQIQASLAAQGVQTEIADQADLPALPPPRHLMRVECADDALTIYDPLGRGFPLAGKDIELIAAGRVTVIEFERTQTSSIPDTNGLAMVDRALFGNRSSGGRYTMQMPQPNYETHEEHEQRWMAEVVIRGGGLRYTMDAEYARQPLLAYLGNRLTDDLAENFKLLVQDLCRCAPQAAVNRGAYYLREGNAASFAYGSVNSFHDEMLWLLWQLKSQS